MTAAPSDAPASAPPLLVMQVITKGETGGAQTHVEALCRALADQVRFTAVIGGSDPQPPLARALHALGVPVQRIAALDNGLAPARVARAVAALVRLIRASRPQLLHAHSAAAGVVARAAGCITRTPVVYTVHGFAFKAGAPWPRRALAWLAEALCAPLTRHLVCVSRHELRLARWLPIPARRCSAVANALDDLPGGAPAHDLPARIVMVARMAPPKRPDLLLHALALLRDASGTEIPATLAGDGPDLAAHQALARRLGLEAVEFTGLCTDVPGLLARHGVFVLLSDHEGLPISVIEAMRAGLAIVASDLPGLRELLPTTAQGLRVPNDARAVAAALQRLAHDPALRAALGRAARQRYEQAHTPAHMAQAVLDIYRHSAAP